jgi:hypothetical protein
MFIEDQGHIGLWSFGVEKIFGKRCINYRDIQIIRTVAQR